MVIPLVKSEYVCFRTASVVFGALFKFNTAVVLPFRLAYVDDVL